MLRTRTAGAKCTTQRLVLYRRHDEDDQRRKAMYLHCLPADINGVSCEDGEVEASVFDRYRDSLYKEASYKPMSSQP